MKNYFRRNKFQGKSNASKQNNNSSRVTDSVLKIFVSKSGCVFLKLWTMDEIKPSCPGTFHNPRPLPLTNPTCWVALPFQVIQNALRDRPGSRQGNLDGSFRVLNILLNLDIDLILLSLTMSTYQV